MKELKPDKIKCIRNLQALIVKCCKECPNKKVFCSLDCRLSKIWKECENLL